MNGMIEQVERVIEDSANSTLVSSRHSDLDEFKITRGQIKHAARVVIEVVRDSIDTLPGQSGGEFVARWRSVFDAVLRK
jgi:hypothetical protein